MRAYDVILNKRNGGSLTSEEIGFLVSGYVKGEIPDSQMAAWLMAVYFRGLDSRETADLTMDMVRSGRVLDLSSIPGVKVDKHSTGGVGDKTTLIVAPLLAAAGVPVVKMSGRSLGYTGGTLDKLESIPGFSISLTPEQMIDQVKRIGIALAGHTMELVPADKKLYALRDLTATVESIPLIAASVMSKKIASGADAIVLDVKAGSGAFMDSVPKAAELARAMVDIGRHVGRETVAVITDMDQPLGFSVGNALEVAESVRTLNGQGERGLVELCVVLGGIGLVLGKKARTREEGEDMICKLISDGSGARKLKELITAQGGNPEIVDDPSLLPSAPIVRIVASEGSGFVERLDAMAVARAATVLGAGRGLAGASPDLAVGINLRKKRGDRVSVGDALAEIHARTEESISAAVQLVREAYRFSESAPPAVPMVYEII
ncbi:MAG TPA: thymidine phosphorylase [Armatimonadota bacterium]|jgi:pyrimidine-nucleoside phosphorylase